MAEIVPVKMPSDAHQRLVEFLGRLRFDTVQQSLIGRMVDFTLDREEEFIEYLMPQKAEAAEKENTDAR